LDLGADFAVVLALVPWVDRSISFSFCRVMMMVMMMKDVVRETASRS